jgi:predicted  nucleic acid-binding Zn-ribbon protein
MLNSTEGFLINGIWLIGKKIMSNHLKHQIEILVQLQNIENETKELKQLIEHAPEKMAVLDGQLEEYEQFAENHNTALDTLRKEYRDFETDSQMALSNIQKSTEKLSAVKTNKEYQSSLKEIEDLKEKNSLLEDKMIQHLEKIDALEDQMSEIKNKVAENAERIKKEKAFIETENDKTRQRLSALNRERDRIEEQIDTKLIKTYQSVQEGGQHVAIAAAIKSVCQGCHMNIPPQMFNELQRFDRLFFCPHCQRIIYWKENEAEA